MLNSTDRLTMIMGRTLRTLAACLALGLSFLPCLFSQSSPDRFAPIVSALRDENYDRALDLLSTALKQFPGHSELWTMQGVAFASKEKKQEALTSFRHAVKIFPDNIPALQGIAQIEFDVGNPAGIPVLEHILHLRPNDRISHGMLAVLEYQQGKCAAAVPHFEKAGALFDTKVGALHAYATCLVRLKQTDKAIEVQQRALDLNSDDRQERRLLASVQLMAHHPDAALTTLEPILAKDPDAETLELAASAHESVHDTEKAVNALRLSILLQPTNTGLYLEFANMAADHQSFQLGIDVINDGLALQPQSAPLYFARGMLHAQLAEYQKAQSDFETAYDLDPGQSLSSAAQGLMAVQQNDLDGALRGVEQKLAAKPDDPILLYLRADILTQQGVETGSAQFRTAMTAAKRAVALRPELAPAHAILAKLYLQSSDYKSAIAECKRTLQLNPKDQTSVYRLIQALRKAGSTAEIPGLLKRLAQLREDATREERERYRYKLVGAVPSDHAQESASPLLP